VPFPHRALAGPRPLVFAHRGGCLLGPENTLVAFDRGLAAGADGLELDARLARDGTVVVLHDPTLDRTTSARGAVSALTADELARVDAAHWFCPEDGYPLRGQSIGVPRLRDVLSRYRDALLIVELKDGEPELARRAVDEIRAASARERVAIGSFHRRALAAAREYEPAIPTGAATEETRWALYRSRLRLPLGRRGYRLFLVPETSGLTRIVSPRFVRAAHAADLPVQVWTVDDAADMRRLIEWGVDALITDRPDVAVGVVRDGGAR
jgi:glycerophosphoryl diester phosphodiesterase